MKNIEKTSLAILFLLLITFTSNGQGCINATGHVLNGPSGSVPQGTLNYSVDAIGTLLRKNVVTVTITADLGNTPIPNGPTVNGVILAPGQSLNVDNGYGACSTNPSLAYPIAIYRAHGASFTVTITAMWPYHYLGSPYSKSITIQ